MQQFCEAYNDSWSRVKDQDAYRDNYDEIFRPKPQTPEPAPDEIRHTNHDQPEAQ